jgi:hypothetical protein
MKALHTIFNLSGKMFFLPAFVVMLAFSTSQAQAPANDACSTATLITCGATVSGSTLNANIDAAPTCGLDVPRFGVWYRIVGQGGMITLSTCSASTNFDTQIGVYSGACESLTCVAGNNNAASCAANSRASSVTFSSTPGVSYYVWVTGVVNSRGNFSLSVTCTTPVPANNDCANAIAVTCGQSVNGTTLGATNAGAPGFCGTSLGTAPGVWYTLAGQTGNTTVSLCGSSFDTKIGVFTGSCGNFTCVAGNDDSCGAQSSVTFPSTDGTTYYIYVTGFSSGAGAFSMSTTCVAPPPVGSCSCTNTAPFGTTSAPTTATPVTITTCNYANEYATINNAIAGNTYTFTSSIATDYLTVHHSSPNGPILGCATTPLTVTATASGPLYLHVNTNAACGTNTTCRATTVACSACTAPPPPPPGTCSCNNSTPWLSVAAPTVPNPLTISTCTFPGEYNTITGAVSGNTYVFTSTGGAYLTVRQGSVGGTVLGCGPSPLTVTATANGSLFLHVNTNAACGAAIVCLTTTVGCSSCVAPPNPCLDAIAITCGSRVTGTTIGGAPAALAPPTCGTTLGTAPGRWYSIVGNGLNIKITTCAAVGFDTKLGVFSGTCANLVCVAGNDDAACSFSALRSTVSFLSQLGTTYYVYVTGFGAGAGAFELSVECRRNPYGLTGDESDAANVAGEVVGLPQGDLTVGQVFPNPLSGNLANLRIESPVETEAVIRFMDQTGRELMLMESDLNVGENLLQISTSRLPAGTYFMMIQVEGNVIPRRVVIPRS